MTKQVEDVLTFVAVAVAVVGGGWSGWWIAGRVRDRILREQIQRKIQEFEESRER